MYGALQGLAALRSSRLVQRASPGSSSASAGKASELQATVAAGPPGAPGSDSRRRNPPAGKGISSAA
jgi:hypothetical protein